MNIFYATDEKYATVCGVSMYSLLMNNRAEDIHIYLIETCLPEHRKRFQEMCGRFGAALTLIEGAEIESQCVQFGIAPFRNSYMNYARLFADKYIQDKAIYLDCDTLVVGSLRPLWEYNLDGCPVGAALDCISNLANVFLDRERLSPYFNSGVLLIDYRMWKKKQFTEKIIASFSRIPVAYTATCGDQDIINHALDGSIRILPPRFNAMYLTRYFSPEKNYIVLRRKKDTYYTSEEIAAAQKKPCVIHYAGRDLLRPWNQNNALSPEENEQWRRYWMESPWKDCPLTNNQANQVARSLIRFYLHETPLPLCYAHGILKEISMKRRLRKSKENE